MKIKNLILLSTIFIFLGCGSSSEDQKHTETQSIKKEEISNLSIKPSQIETTPIESKRYIRELNNSVTDTIFHLTWQDNNESNTTKLNWQDAFSYCENLSLDNFDDWRLPEVKELFYLSNKGEQDSAFVNISLEMYHTNTTYNPIKESSWYINFNYGFDYVGSKESIHHVRCVRGEKYTTNFIKEQNSTVTDINTKLMWQDNTDIQDIQKGYEEAKGYCSDLILENYSDWRIPNINELYSITDHNQSNPAINSIFKIKTANNFWSSTPSSSGYAWSMNFFQGSNYYHGDEYGWQNIETPLYIRCVRDHIPNNAPIASSQDITLSEDTPKEFQLQATDSNNDILIYHITTVPQHGSLSSQMPNITYKPDPNYSGSDSFSYIVNDGTIDSNTATVNITITPINDAPIADNISDQSINEDNNLTLTLSATDIDGDKLTYNIVTNPKKGAILLTDNNVSYKPNENYNGTDSFTFRANDGIIDSNLINVNLTINPINDYPIFLPINEINTTEDDFIITGVITASDLDGDFLLFSADSTTSFTLTSDGNYTFNQIEYQNLGEGSLETLSIPITVSDGILTAEQNLIINIRGINDAPIASPIAEQSIDEDNNITLTLSATDIDGDELTYHIINTPTNGYILLSGNHVQYIPNENYNGNDNFILKAYDGVAYSNSIDINVSINPINDSPIFSPINEINITEDSPIINGTITASDPDEDSLTFSVPFVNNFTLTSAGNYTFNPMNYQNLTEGSLETLSIPISVSDGTLTVEQNLIINITGINDAPIADAGGDITEIEGNTITFDGALSSDVDDLIVTHEWKENTTILADNNISFTKGDFSVGTYTVTLTVTDEYGSSSVDTISITINPIVDTASFISHTVTTNATKSEWLEMVDLDNDGDLDILSVSTGNSGEEVTWHENHGNNTFTTHTITADANAPESIKSADIDGDGDLDIFYTTYASGASLMQCINDGNQNFSCNPITNATNNLSYIEIINFDKQNDNLLDIITSSWGNNRVEWLKNSGDGTFTGPHMVDYENSDEAISTHIADFNKDNKTDIVAAYHSSNRIDWYAYDTNGSGNFEHHFVADINGTYSVDVIDINNDSYDDILTTSNIDGKIYWYKSTQSTSPTFGTALEIATLPNLYYASGVDMDHDGDIDILSNSSETDGKIVWYENIGSDTNFIEHNVTTNAYHVIRSFGADMDNDGNMDIVAGNQDGNIIVYENNAPTFITLIPKTGDTTSLTTGDDGDLQKGSIHVYSRNDTNETVLDNTVNILWEDTTNVSSNTYTWDDANTYCQSLSLDGLNNWRLPSIHELYFLLDRSKSAPTITAGFINTSSDTAGYWTSSQGSFSKKLWVGFSDVRSEQDYSSNAKFVRCISGSFFNFSFIRDDNREIVSDHVHNLQWQDNAEIESNSQNWDDAIAYCQNLTFDGSGWRLPNINELYTLSWDGSWNSIFSYGSSSLYWSSTGGGGVTTLDFYGGYDNGKARTDSAKIRCVREILPL